MLRSTFYQQSLLEVDPDELRLARTSFERGLRAVLPKIVSVDDFLVLHPSAEGADTCDPLVLTGMLLLQFRFDLSDRDLINRCRRDLGFRYALALEKGIAAPCVASLKRFRSAIRRLKGPEWLFGLSLRLPKEAGMVSAGELQGVDSTNTDQRGATLDSYNLICAAIRQVVRRVAELLGRDWRDLAREWDATRYLARSLKGQVAIDWSKERERNELITSEILDMKRIAGLVDQTGLVDEDLTEAVALMRQVALQDVEQLPDGTFRVAQGTAAGRIVSVSDPAAGHGRKSAAKKFIGFKTHVAGTLESQFISAIFVTGAGVHDSVPTTTLIAQAGAAGLKPKDLVGDNAYGTGANRRACNELDVTLHTKLSSPSHPGFTKRDFAIDLVAMSVTCPNGVTTSTYKMGKDPQGSGERVPRFTFPKATCMSCPLREQCGSATKDRGRLVTLNHHEVELQEAQRMNAQPGEKALLRRRSAIERLLAHLIRMGMRQAKFFGIEMVRFQAFMTAAAYNLQRYMTLAAAAR